MTPQTAEYRNRSINESVMLSLQLTTIKPETPTLLWITNCKFHFFLFLRVHLDWGVMMTLSGKCSGISLSIVKFCNERYVQIFLSFLLENAP